MFGASRPRETLSLFVLLVAAATGSGVAAVVDLDGRQVDPWSSQAPFVVLIFVAPDCPISNRLAPEMARIFNDYHPRGVDFYLVYPDPGIAVETLRTHVHEFRLPLPPVRDLSHDLVRHTGATVTPEAVILNRRRDVLYRGRINNRFVDFGKTRPRATRHDLREALEAVLAGRPVAEPRTQAIGCFVAPLSLE